MTDVQAFLRGLKSASDVPVVALIVGSEKLLADRAVATIRDLIVPEGLSGFAEQSFHASETDVVTVVQTAKTLPMMCERRLVMVRGAEVWKAADWEQLGSYFGNPNPSSCLLISADKLDGRSRFARVAKKSGFWIDTTSPKGQGLVQFVLAEVEARGNSMSRSVALALVDAIGEDLASLNDAVERLSLFVGERAPIDMQALEMCIKVMRIDTIWSLVDAIAHQDVKTALSAVGSLLSDRQAPLRIFAMIARQIRMLARVHGLLEGGASVADAAKAAGVPPFKAHDFAKSARAFSAEMLRMAFAILADTDIALKGHYCPGGLILERAVMQLCQCHARSYSVRVRIPDLRPRLSV